jgi:hypothetical protein
MSNAAVQDNSQHNFTRTLYAITWHRANFAVFSRMLEQARQIMPHLTPDDFASAILNAALRENGDRIPSLPMLSAEPAPKNKPE